MAQGSFEVPLKMTVPLSLWKKLEPFGHIVVFGQNLNPNEIGDQAALDAARYSGVLLGKDTSGEGVTLSGCGMTWWLGDDLDNGPMVENKVVLTGATLSEAISAVLPDSITVGTINNAGLSTFTGDFHWVTPLEAIREICLALGAEFRVNPNGTIDAGLKENVFVITNPEVVMVRRGFGTDHQYKSVPVTNMRSWLDAREYVTKVSAVIKELDGTRTLVDSSTRDPNWVDIHGN